MSRHKGSDETGERWDYLAVECRGKDHNVLCDSGDTAEEVAAAWNRRFPSRQSILEEAAKGWRDIETAPDASDPEPILIFGGRHKHPTLALPDGEHWRALKRDGNKAIPTHWMPLPAPPLSHGKAPAKENGDE